MLIASPRQTPTAYILYLAGHHTSLNSVEYPSSHHISMSMNSNCNLIAVRNKIITGKCLENLIKRNVTALVFY